MQASLQQAECLNLASDLIVSFRNFTRSVQSFSSSKKQTLLMTRSVRHKTLMLYISIILKLDRQIIVNEPLFVQFITKMGNQCNQCVGNNISQNPVEISKLDKQFRLGILGNLSRAQQMQNVKMSKQAQKTIEGQSKFHIQQSALNSKKPLWKVKQPHYCFVYADQQTKDCGQGQVMIYFVNESNNEFQGYYQGKLEKAQPIDKNALFVFPDGAYFIGSIKNLEAQGKGVYVNQQKKINYDGFWSRSLPNGRGSLNTKKYTYEGDFVDGVKKGKGFIQWQDSEFADASYQGQFDKNDMHGFGKLTRDGFTYQGNFSFGKFDGKGRWQKKSYTYYGNFKNGVRDGIGQLKFQNGNVFYGQFKNDVPHGKGTLKQQGKKNIEGMWLNGKNICCIN